MAAGATSHVQAGTRPSQAQLREPSGPADWLMRVTLPGAGAARVLLGNGPAVLQWGDNQHAGAGQGLARIRLAG